jgi:hypothetical integral membrane protein (TIGR02206 family)
VTLTVSPGAYGAFVGVAALACALACRAGRRRPGPWRVVVARVVAVALWADAVSWIVALVVQGTFSLKTSLPLALCNMAVLVAGAACWWRTPVLVELTYFWGLAGTLQAVVTPDLNVGFPHLVFFQYVIAHLGIVVAAVFLVVGMGITPRAGAVWRTLAITAGYTTAVGIVDALSGADYMFLRQPPANWTLLRVLGPWPWYVVSAAGVGLVLFVVLDVPFRPGRAARTAAAGRRGFEAEDVPSAGRPQPPVGAHGLKT